MKKEDKKTLKALKDLSKTIEKGLLEFNKKVKRMEEQLEKEVINAEEADSIIGTALEKMFEKIYSKLGVFNSFNALFG